MGQQRRHGWLEGDERRRELERARRASEDEHDPRGSVASGSSARGRHRSASPGSGLRQPPPPVAAIGLQRQVGNRATARLLGGDPPAPLHPAVVAGSAVPSSLVVQRLFGLGSRRGQAKPVSEEDQERYYDLTHVDPAILATIEPELDPSHPRDRAMLTAIRKERARLASSGEEEGGKGGTGFAEESSSRATGSDEVGSRSVPPRGRALLDAMLENATAWAAFSKYAATRLVEESTGFLVAVREYEEEPTPERAQEIWAKFVDPKGAELAINIDAPMVRTIQQEVQSGSTDPKLFQAAFNHIASLLEPTANAFPGYQDGALWRQAVRALGCDVPEPATGPPPGPSRAPATGGHRRGLLGMLRSLGGSISGKLSSLFGRRR